MVDTRQHPARADGNLALARRPDPRHIPRGRCLPPARWQLRSGDESGWSVTAANPGSGAFGIPQALPGSRMASAGPDWQTSAATQIKWGLQYIKGTYGSPCAAWAHSQATGWY